VKVGDLVKHSDGDLGLVIDIDFDDDWYPYLILFSGLYAWFSSRCVTKVINESR
jgi:hypothetical protein